MFKGFLCWSSGQVFLESTMTWQLMFPCEFQHAWLHAHREIDLHEWGQNGISRDSCYSWARVKFQYRWASMHACMNKWFNLNYDGDNIIKRSTKTARHNEEVVVRCWIFSLVASSKFYFASAIVRKRKEEASWRRLDKTKKTNSRKFGWSSTQERRSLFQRHWYPNFNESYRAIIGKNLHKRQPVPSRSGITSWCGMVKLSWLAVS